MKIKLLHTLLIAIGLLCIPKVNFGQAVAPTLGTAANFAIFSSAGAVTSSSSLLYLTHVTGNIGSQPASTSGFGNVDGVLYQGGTTFGTGTTDVQATYAQLNGLTPTNALATPFGAGVVLVEGVYAISSASQLTGDLILDAQGDADAVFIFQLGGAFNTAANTKVKLVNGALACNVFWKVEGAVTMAAGTSMKGTIIANNDFISMAANDTLEGRALSLNGAVSMNQTVVYLPKGCNSPVLTGPIAPTLGSSECYGIFTSDGPVTDDGASRVVGDIGTNGPGDLTIGYNPLFVTGTIHPIADASTAQCATDVGVAYSYVNTLAEDIILLRPDLFGHDLVLTPHTYRMNGAVTFTDSVFLNGEGNPDAVFIIKVYGAFNTNVGSKVVLTNGTQAKNVYWMINGAVDININSIFNGSFISAGAIDLQTGVRMNGRAFTTVGAINTYAIITTLPSGSAGAAGPISGDDSVCSGQTGVIYSVAPIAGATDYSWTVPIGATITSSDTTNTIAVTFGPLAISGNVTVQGTGTCSNGSTSTFTVIVNQPPTVNFVPNQTVCNNEQTMPVIFTGTMPGTTYSWTNTDSTIGLAANGTGNINPFTAINTTALTIIATITVTPTANGCDGADTSFTITVNPTPVVDSVTDQAVCNNSQTAAVLFTGTVAGTTYNWTNSDTTIGLAASGSGDINPFTATNTTANAVIATITVTPTANGCAGTDTSFTITVNPTPTVNSVASQTVCANTTTTAIAFGGSVAGATYNWTNDNTSIGLAASGTGTIAAFIGSNTTLVANTANITVTPTANTCTGAATSFTITVDPAPMLDTVADQTLCNTATTAPIVFSGAGVGATYSWTNDNTSIGLAASGNGDINSFTATNTGSVAAIATIIVISPAPGCDGTTLFTITVNPTPTTNPVGNQTVCTNTATTPITFSGAVAGTTYNWTNNNTSIGLAAAGNGDIAAFTATNTGVNVVTATITVTPTETTTGCAGSATAFTIAVDPCPTTDFHIPEGFSPNADGINDLFIVRGIQNYPANTFEVFNRWGDKLFGAAPYQNTWDGKATTGVRLGDNELPTGTYFYILDLGNNSPIYKGTIYLNR